MYFVFTEKYDLNKAPELVKKTLAVMKGSMSKLLDSVVGKKKDLSVVISRSKKMVSHLQLLVSVYRFVRNNQKRLFKIYNQLKGDIAAAFDFIEQTILGKFEKAGESDLFILSLIHI